MIKKNLFKIVLILLIFPLTFININQFHDWGGDFAQYLDQTKDFLSGTSSFELEIIDSENFTPAQRGAGFSIMLSPIYYLFGNNIRFFIFFISISLFLLGIVLFGVFNDKEIPVYSKFVSLLLVLTILYNYHFLRLKMEIMPVFPFMLILYSCLILYKKESQTSFWMFSLLTGLLISMKNIGFCFYIAVLAHLIISICKNYKLNKLKRLLIFVFVPILFDSFIKWLIFNNVSIQNITWYNDVFTLTKIKATFFENFYYYLNAIMVFFEQEIWWWANILIKNTALILFLIGLIKKLRTKIAVMDTFFILYIGLLLCYPYNKTGMRFLLPVIPIILIYIVSGINVISSKLNFGKKHLISFFLIVVISSNYINVKNIILNNDKYIRGPQNKEAMEAFQAIKENVSMNSVIAFPKPWVLHFYTERNSICLDYRKEINEIEKRLSKHNVKHLLLCSDPSQTEVYNKKLLYQISNSSNYKTIWENKKFILFELADT